MIDLIVDTNVFVSALISEAGASREVIRRCLQRRYQPCISLALFAEYRDVLGRHELFASCPLDATERDELFRAFMAVCRMTDIYYLWRPNLPDEADNHVLELAVAARAAAIVTHNRADFVRSELRFPELRILAPAELLKET
ncbi:MAG: putative toxin-antitoxin system toxin component, PIN family [Sulfuritalea sp.]|nr:putative toxin-antitoxin system toxin component, PIN family [Sulfuritalea sp.]